MRCWLSRRTRFACAVTGSRLPQRRSARGEVYPWSSCGAAHEPRWFSSPMACHQGREAEALHSPLAPRFPPALVTRKEPVSSLLCAEWPVSVTECSYAPENAPQPPYFAPKMLHERDMRPKRTIEWPVSQAMCRPGNTPPALEESFRSAYLISRRGLQGVRRRGAACRTCSSFPKIHISFRNRLRRSSDNQVFGAHRVTG